MDSEKAEFIACIRHVPYETVHRVETLHKLERYAALLIEWNGKFNLVGEATLPHVWKRHFLDSAQLLKYIPQSARSIADLGSGAGFPGIVLSILGTQNVHLIESIGKKAGFLRAVVDELKLDAIVHQARIEDLHKLKADIVTARALKPLPELLGLAKALMHKESIGLFLKGKSLEDELTESAQSWKFEAENHVSLSDPSGRVLIIRDLQPKNAAPRRKQRKKLAPRH